MKPIAPSGPTGTPITDPSKDPRLKDPANILSKRSIYFDFDSDAIKAEFVPLVEAHAAFLRQYKTAKMLIQGNADDRGSREYNLGLGPAAGGRGEEAPRAARRDRVADRVGQPGRGEAGLHPADRGVLGAEPPGGYPVRG